MLPDTGILPASAWHSMPRWVVAQEADLLALEIAQHGRSPACLFEEPAPGEIRVAVAGKESERDVIAARYRIVPEQ